MDAMQICSFLVAMAASIIVGCQGGLILQEKALGVVSAFKYINNKLD